jgi:heme/copper-type cytochrome/quinol oxidase subunit 1
MSLDRAPAFSFAALAGSAMLVASLPVLVANLALLYVDYQYFRAAFNGNQGIASYIDWTWSQPQIYVAAIFGLGVIAEIVPVFARHRMVLRGAVLSGIGLFAASSFGAWSSLLYGDGDTPTNAVAIGLGALAAPGVLVLLGLGGLTFRQGTPRFGAPLVFALGAGLMAAATVAFGALTAIEPLDVVGTTWEEGILLYTVLGVVLLPAMGAVTYWAPRLWGRSVPNGPAAGLGALGLIAVILASLPDMALGFFNDQVLGEVNIRHEDASQALNIVHGVGLVLMGLVVLAFVLLVAKAVTGPRSESADPWHGHTLEWAGATPVDSVTSAEPLLDHHERHGAAQEVTG